MRQQVFGFLYAWMLPAAPIEKKVPQILERRLLPMNVTKVSKTDKPVEPITSVRRHEKLPLHLDPVFKPRKFDFY